VIKAFSVREARPPKRLWRAELIEDSTQMNSGSGRYPAQSGTGVVVVDIFFINHHLPNEHRMMWL
jgi:hypothetical protein